MKKLLFTASLSTVFALCNAQTSFGIQAGANFASAKVESIDGATTTKLNVKSKTGLVIGALAEIHLASFIHFRPELNFIQKGFKLDETNRDGGNAYREKLKATLNYIELPLNFVYSAPAGQGSFFVGLGPTLGFGISGKYKIESSFTSGSTTTTETETIKIKFDGDEDPDDDNGHFKAFDLGGNILAGYKLSNGVFFSANYTLGLSNISTSTDDESFKNKGFSVKIGYMFGGKKSKGMKK